MVHIRQEKPEDLAAIRQVHEQAFGRRQEADLVDALRRNYGDLISLVSLENHQVVGHALFSPVTIETEGKTVVGMGLGPVAVLPAHQRRGVGTRLIEYGIKMLVAEGCPLLVVLGDPAYYQRFGFQPAGNYGITCEWEVPENSFMVLGLDASNLPGVKGMARYRPEFAQAL